MTPFTVTISFAALYAITLVPMTGWIGLYRDRIGALRGDGGDPVLYKRIRYHGNLTENAPATFMALAAAESLGLMQPWLWAAVVSFILGRVLYFIQFDKKSRALALSFTQFPAALLAIWCLYSLFIKGA